MNTQTMLRLRKFHYYVGVFFAPMIILFALSGAFQTFRWQEEKGYGGPPPRWIVWMASVHIDQTRPKPPAAEAEKPKAVSADAKPTQAKKVSRKRLPTLALKTFVALVAVGLILSSLLGITIALNNRATRRMSVIMLAVGAAAPILLVLL